MVGTLPMVSGLVQQRGAGWVHRSFFKFSVRNVTAGVPATNFISTVMKIFIHQLAHISEAVEQQVSGEIGLLVK